MRRVQLRGGARRPHARRTLCTLSVRPRAPTKQMGPYRGPGGGEMALLEATGISKRFGSLLAVNRVEVRIEAGAIHAIIGPNGAGKTTLFNCVTGLHTPDDGTIVFKGRPLEGIKPHQR